MGTIRGGEHTNLRKAVLLSTAGALFLSLMALCSKLALPHSTEPVLTFFRFSIAALYIFAMLLMRHLRGCHISLKTQHLGMHIMRAIASTGAMYSLYYALRYIPLVNANLLSLTYPLFALVLIAIFFKEKPRLFSWLAMMVGFMGIIFVLKPTLTLFNLASGVGLFSGLCAAVSILGIRELSQHEHPYTILFYYTSIALLISSALVVFYWQTPDNLTLLALLGVGVFGVLYQELLTRALIYAPAYIPSSFMYLSVVFSGIFGMLIWRYIPDGWSWFGIGLVCLSNIIIIILK